MISKDKYIYTSKVVLLSAILFFILFIILQYFLTYSKKVNIIQAILTISLSLFIFSFIIKNGYEQQEVDSLLFYSTFIFGIPLLYHLLYLTFFSYYTRTKIKIDKIYILFIILIYLSYIWYNTKKLLHLGVINNDLLSIINKSLKIIIFF